MSVLGGYESLGLDLDTLRPAVNGIYHLGKPECGDKKAVPYAHALKWKNPFRLSQLVQRH